jgi:hypothetical protein
MLSNSPRLRQILYTACWRETTRQFLMIFWSGIPCPAILIGRPSFIKNLRRWTDSYHSNQKMRKHSTNWRKSLSSFSSKPTPKYWMRNACSPSKRISQSSRP